MDGLYDKKMELEFISSYIEVQCYDTLLNIEKMNGYSIGDHFKVTGVRNTYTFRYESSGTFNNRIKAISYLTEKINCVQKVLDIVSIKKLNKFCIISLWIVGTTVSEYISKTANQVENISVHQSQVHFLRYIIAR